MLRVFLASGLISNKAHVCATAEHPRGFATVRLLYHDIAVPQNPQTRFATLTGFQVLGDTYEP